MVSNLVFGATSAIGQFLLPKLLAGGERVFAVSRQGQADREKLGIDWLRGDLFAAMPATPAVDNIYSLGPLDAFATWFAQNEASAQRVIAISSMSAQSKQDSVNAAERDLSVRLRAAEEKLFASARLRDVACTILRPTLIYGSGRDASLAPLARFARRWRVLPIPLGASGLRQPVHAADLAEACIGVRVAAATFGKVYRIGGAERLRFDEMLARIAALAPRAALPLRIPIPLITMAARLLRGRVSAGAVSRLRSDLVADNGPAQCDFGYAPRAFDAADVLPSEN